MHQSNLTSFCCCYFSLSLPFSICRWFNNNILIIFTQKRAYYLDLFYVFFLLNFGYIPSNIDFSRTARGHLSLSLSFVLLYIKRLMCIQVYNNHLSVCHDHLILFDERKKKRKRTKFYFSSSLINKNEPTISNV